MPAVAAGPPGIRTHGLGRRFGGLWAVKDLDLDIPPGTLTGLIGPNGAGKTTSLRMLLGLLRPTAGTVLYDDRPLCGGPDRVPVPLRAILEGPAFEPRMSAVENLEHLSRIAGTPAPGTEIGSAMERVGLHEAASRPFRSYSTGMKQRLAIAWCLVGRPRLLVLDEPANGLDPEFQISLREILRELGRSGDTTLVVSSHILKELQEVARHVAVILQGRVVLQGPVGTLLGSSDAIRVRIRAHPPEGLGKTVAAVKGIELIDHDGGTVRIRLPPDKVPGLIARLVHEGLDVHEVVEEKLSLEDLYMRSLTGDGPGVGA